jgi:Tfp pilus assembly protein PilO
VKLTPKRKIIAGAVGTVVIMGLIYTASISPANSRESKSTAQLSSVQSAIAGDRAQLTQLEALASHQPAMLAKAFRLSKAVPLGTQTPGMIIELQSLAKASNVTLSQVRTISTTAFGNLNATVYEIDVVGRFLDVDDFLYRVHHQVSVTPRGRVRINGRLFAVTGVQLSLAGSSGSSSSAGASSNSVLAVMQLMTFSSGGATGSSSGGNAAGGSTGASGASGASGATGASGASGASGATGSSTTPSGTSTTAPSSSGGPG